MAYYKDCCACRNVLRCGFKFLPFFCKLWMKRYNYFLLVCTLYMQGKCITEHQNCLTCNQCRCQNCPALKWICMLPSLYPAFCQRSSSIAVFFTFQKCITYFYKKCKIYDHRVDFVWVLSAHRIQNPCSQFDQLP